MIGQVKRLLTILANAFPLWIILGCGWAWIQPSAWTWFKPHIAPGLGVIMLGMGLTLRFVDFAAVTKDLKNVAIGSREALRRTISIEVGMQNSGLGAALATKHFPHLVLAPVPAAISAVYHGLIGSLLAACWRKRPVE
jgi:predicted Na+-dependent transporter